MSLAKALDLLGPIRAWATTDAEGNPVFWLDGRITTEREIKKEAHRVWVERNDRSY